MQCRASRPQLLVGGLEFLVGGLQFLTEVQESSLQHLEARHIGEVDARAHQAFTLQQRHDQHIEVASPTRGDCPFHIMERDRVAFADDLFDEGVQRDWPVEEGIIRGGSVHVLQLRTKEGASLLVSQQQDTGRIYHDLGSRHSV